ncbi:unnamed protein product [Miscanthus lutarioriparius]|uniref:DUF7032 domain-containing protein n=1 Tax=Miscanthus lutarioriparius TaxID=422564 RepID=A0A811MRX2_9POAL|nr:unnamed protein product [Miscanthus lutarioriparius]
MASSGATRSRPSCRTSRRLPGRNGSWCRRARGGGKLRLRSDLDVLAAALDVHVARLDEVYASGALTRAWARVVPCPGAGASRDDLFTRLRVGGYEMWREAVAALTEVLHDDEKCVRVVASDVADGVGVRCRAGRVPGRPRPGGGPGGGLGDCRV